MRTNVVIDDRLMADALENTGLKTKKAVILCEVLQGFRRQQDFQAAREALLRFRVYTMTGTGIALKGAESYRALRRQGITVRKTIGCLIATFVIDRGFSLLHSDRDFDPFEVYLGLDVAR